MSELPNAFCERIRAQYPSISEEFLEALDRPAKSSIRYNGVKPSEPLPAAASIPWNDEGYWLHERPVFTLDPLFHAGCYYPQESSSMFLQWVLKQTVPLEQGLMALDLCAAPGGKTLILADYIQSHGVVVSNEIIPARARILREVVTKWGADNTVVCNGSPDALGELEGWFDVILVDAPCSGEGMFRKDPAAREEWNTQSAEQCSLRQHEILTDILPALKENGVLIYSTCTFAPDENERMLGALVDSGEYESIRFEVPPQWSVDVYDTKEVFACRFLPHRTDGEGFFIGALRKKCSSGKSRAKPKAVFKSIDAPSSGVIKSWCNALRYPVLGTDGDIYDSPFDLNRLNMLASQVFVLQPGLHLGRVVRHDFIPDHALAMSNRLPGPLAALELDRPQALDYLRGEAVPLPQGVASGWCLASYNGHALGWLKVIGNRVNNYYPKEWRVRMR